MEEPHNRIEDLFRKTRLLCFGRFIISVPETAIVMHGTAELDGRFSVYPDQVSKIHEVVSSRLREALEEKNYLSDSQVVDLPSVGTEMDGELPGQKLVFGAKGTIGYTIHSYMPLKSDLFVLEINNINEKERVLQEINRFAKKLRLRDDVEVPAESGICVERGFIDIYPEYENIAFGLRFKEFPDVRFSVQTRKNGKYLRKENSPTALREGARRRASVLELASFFSRITTLREGLRQLDDWEGEEILTRRPAYKDDTDAHEFRFYSAGQLHDALHPQLDIRLDSGVEGNSKATVRPGITNVEALELWDKLLPTIRIRQPSDATPPITHLSNLPLGSIGRSGDICFQSGWWECLEKRKIDGERRRFLKAGDKLPLVVASGGANLWRTLIGYTQQVALVEWKLLEYENTLPSSTIRKEDGSSLANSGAKNSDA